MEHRTLVLLRHGKAEPGEGLRDVDRPLSGSGRRDARAAGGQLAGWDLRLDLVLCSAAVRTRQTWDEAVAGGAGAGEVRYLPELYAATTTGLIELTHGLPDSAGSVLLVGHGPALPQLAAILAGPEPLGHSSYPTCGLTRLELSGSWVELSPARTRLVSFVVPRG